jgi:hypothetical protein
MSYWTHRELALFRELNFLDHKKIKIRKTQWCYNSGRSIEKGKEVDSVKVYPSSADGYSIGLDMPRTFYKCGRCGECTH